MTIWIVLATCASATAQDSENVTRNWGMPEYIDSLFRICKDEFRPIRLRRITDSTKYLKIAFPYLDHDLSEIVSPEEGSVALGIHWTDSARMKGDPRAFFNDLRNELEAGLPYDYDTRDFDRSFPGRHITYYHRYEFTNARTEAVHIYPLVRLIYRAAEQQVSMYLVSPNPPDEWPDAPASGHLIGLLGADLGTSDVLSTMMDLSYMSAATTKDNPVQLVKDYLHKGVTLVFNSIWRTHPKILTKIYFDIGDLGESGMHAYRNMLPFDLMADDAPEQILSKLEGAYSERIPIGETEKYRVEQVQGLDGFSVEFYMENGRIRLISFELLPNEITIEEFRKKKKKLKLNNTY